MLDVATLEDRRDGSPAEQLRLALERSLAGGVSFDLAWTRGYGNLKWPHDTTDRRAWKAILEADRERWRGSYEAVELRGVEAALRALAPAPVA